MSRYIDADALKKRVSELIVPDWTRTLIRSWLDSEPTVDAVPVVRCGECKYHWKNGGDCVAELDFFCADGERRSDEDQHIYD